LVSSSFGSIVRGIFLETFGVCFSRKAKERDVPVDIAFPLVSVLEYRNDHPAVCQFFGALQEYQAS